PVVHLLLPTRRSSDLDRVRPPRGDAADVPLGAADSYPIHRRAVPDRQRPLGRLLPGGLPLPPGRGGGRPAGPSAVGAGERGRLPRSGGPLGAAELPRRVSRHPRQRSPRARRLAVRPGAGDRPRSSAPADRARGELGPCTGAGGAGGRRPAGGRAPSPVDPVGGAGAVRPLRRTDPDDLDWRVCASLDSPPVTTPCTASCSPRTAVTWSTASPATPCTRRSAPPAPSSRSRTSDCSPP